MIRIVLDTNVLVSGLLIAHGSEAAVLSIVAAGAAIWCVSPAILAEYGDVLRRPKFAKIPRSYVDALLAHAHRAELVRPDFTVTVSSHEADNRFLECAEAAGADYLVTGNQRHFPRRHKTAIILSPRSFLNAVA